MIDFSTIDYLENGNDKQKRVFQILKQKKVMSNIAEFDPILVGTIPINIDIDSSDLDIICCWSDKNVFVNKLKNIFGKETNFKIRELLIDTTETVIANFKIKAFEIEIFGQNIPVKKQNGYRHMIIEYEILKNKGEAFRLEIVKLKQKGYKTEPAFGLLLGLTEDPYLQLLTYKIE